MVNLSLKCNTLTFAILYLAVPIMLFFLFWLQLPWGILFTALLSYACYSFNRQVADRYQALLPSYANVLSVAFLIVLVYLVLTGHGSFVGSEGFDMPWRSAMYQDLIHQSWPVVYEASNSALVYYLTYWLVPAGISSILGLEEIGSNLVLVLWTYLGLRLFLLLLFSYLQVDRKQIILVTLLFLFWSGLNLIGIIISPINSSRWGWDKWWYTNTSDGSLYPMSYMVRTVFDSLANIYNQFAPILLGLMLFLFTRNVKYYALIGLLVLPFSPFGFLGLFFILTGLFLWQVLEERQTQNIKGIIRQALSKENVLATLSIFPVFLLYFTGNTSASTSVSFLSAPWSAYGLDRLVMLFLYYCLQFGLFMLAVYRFEENKKLWWLTLVELMLLPLFSIGNSCDLCWNGSIPGFFLVMIFVMRYFIACWQKKVITKRFLLVYTLLVVAALTPLMQMHFQLRQCVQLRIPLVRADEFKFGDTFSKLTTEEASKKFRNFLTQDYENKPFYRYLAKKS